MTVTFSMAVLAGLAIASVNTATPPRDTVQADGAQQVVEPTSADESQSPTAAVGEPDSLEEPEEPEEPAVASQPTPLEVDAGVADPPDPSTEPVPTEQPVAEATATGVPASDPSGEPEPDPTDAPDRGPKEPPAVDQEPAVRVFGTSAGDLTVQYTRDQIVGVEPAPAPGFTSEIQKMEPTEVKVIFTADGSDDESVVEVEIHLEDGELTHDVSPDDADL